jgi:hypothetical protein
MGQQLRGIVQQPGELDGTWHANRTGQLAMADIIYTGIMPGLTGITSGLYPDGTFVQVNETGQVYRIAGGAPLYVSTWSAFGGA